MANIKKILFSISIAIVLALFVGYGINSFYHPPKYEDYCTETSRYAPEPMKFYASTGQIVFSENCSVICESKYPSKEFQAECDTKKGYVVNDYDERGCIESFKCETCQKEFDDVNQIYNRNVFIITSIVGLLALLVGGFFVHVESVSAGIMGGGILTIIYGTIRFWTDLPDYGRFTILGIALAVLIWAGYKKIKK